MPLIKKCKVCKSTFRTKPFFIRNGGGIYCSSRCHHLGMRNGRMVECFICKQKTYKTLKALKSSKSKKFFCTKSCQTTWRNSIFIGEKHGNWSGGRYAYRSVLLRHKILKKCVLCGTGDVRVLAVHHVDQNRTNNKVENLTWLCHNCHHLVHHHLGEKERLQEKIK